MLSQILNVSMIGLRSIPQRLWMSLTTVLSVGIVIAVLLAFLAMGNGFQKTVSGSGADDVAIVLRGGSGAEINSSLSRDQLALLEAAPGVQRAPDGTAIVSGELFVPVDGTKKSSGTEANISLRGIGPQGLALRPDITIVEGRMFAPGAAELVVGRAVLEEFTGFEMGRTIRFGDTQWQVVGVFDAGATVFGSEVWADIRVVQSLFNRGSGVQSARLKLGSPDQIAAVQAYADADQRLNVEVRSERAYFAEQSQQTNDLILSLGWPLSIVMALGALAGALNTMYTSVAARAREIATLRAIGFGSVSAFFGTLTESLTLAILGGVVGATGAYLLFDGLSASTLGGSFTQVVFSFSLGPELIGQGSVLAIIIGLIGGVFPALRAARLPLLMAFRDN